MKIVYLFAGIKTCERKRKGVFFWFSFWYLDWKCISADFYCWKPKRNEVVFGSIFNLKRRKVFKVKVFITERIFKITFILSKICFFFLLMNTLEIFLVFLAFTVVYHSH